MDETRYTVKYPFERNAIVTKVITLCFTIVFVLISTPYSPEMLLSYSVVTSLVFIIHVNVKCKRFRGVLEELRTKGNHRLQDFKESRPLLIVSSYVAAFLIFLIIIALSRSTLILGGGLGFLSGFMLSDISYYLYIRNWEIKIGRKIYLTIITRAKGEKLFVSKELILA